MADKWPGRPRSMESLLPPNYVSDDGQFELGLPRIRPAWLLDESIKSLDSKFPMVPAPTGTIVLYTTPLGEMLRQQPKNKEFDLRDPLRPCLSYNYLHDEHLKVYFRSNDIRRRLIDKEFITDDGYVKCSLKEFNEYRQWIRKLKLDELGRERRRDAMQIEKAKKERLEKIALERDPELLEIMRKRRELRKEQTLIRKKRIEREKNRQRQLEEIDHKRRAQFISVRRKTKDRVLLKRELERERRRKSKNEKERTDQKIRFRIVKRMENDNDERMIKLQEKKKEDEESKSKKLEERWYRRQSWSIEHHEHQKNFRELAEKEFQHNADERQTKVLRQRRWSQVCFDEVAMANRRAFETDIANAEVFMAKLKEKRTRELHKWKEHFEGMKASSHSSIPSSCNSVISKIKKRGRRQSDWDLESCLLKDLGLDDSEIEENAYSKLGVISRMKSTLKEFAPLGKGKELGSLQEVEEHEEETGIGLDPIQEEPVFEKQPRFSIPMIVESLASLREPSSDDESEISGCSGFVNEDDKGAKISRSPSKVNNENLTEEELRRRIAAYVQNILQRSAMALGVQVKVHEKLTQLEQPAIAEEVQEETQDANRRIKVKKFLSSILDKTEKAEGIIIKRPPEYEKIKEKSSQKSKKKAIPTAVSRIIDAEKILRDRKILVRKLVSNIVQCAAKQEGITIDFPLHYQYLMKQPSNKEHRNETTKSSINVTDYSLVRPESVSPQDRSMDIAGRHSAVLRAISSGRICLESATEDTGHCYRNSPDGSESRADRLRNENLTMTASRVVIDALYHAINVVGTQRKNSDFFMAEMPKTSIESLCQPSNGEKQALLKRERSKCFAPSLKSIEEKEIPREIDFLKKIGQRSQTAVNTGSNKTPLKEELKKTVHFQKEPGNKNAKKPVSKVESETVKKNGDEVAKNSENSDKAAKRSKETGKEVAGGVSKEPGEKTQSKVEKETGEKMQGSVGKYPPDKVTKDGAGKIPDKGGKDGGGKIPEKSVKDRGEKLPKKVVQNQKVGEKKVCKEPPKKKDVKTVKELEKEPGDSGKTGKEPGDSGKTDKEPGDSGKTDKELGDSGETDKEPGDSGETDKEPGDSGETDKEPGTSKVCKELVERIVDEINEDPAMKITTEKNSDEGDQDPGEENQSEMCGGAGGTGIESKEDMATLERESECPSLPQITPESSRFGLENSVRSGAVTPSREMASSPERHIAGSPSSAIIRMITMRERQEDCELSPQSSYVILPKLSSSESSFIAGKMERLFKDYDHVPNRSGTESSSHNRFPTLSPVPSSETDTNSPTVTAEPLPQDVTLPRVSSVEICPQRSPTPSKCTSQSSLVALPQLESSHSSSLVASSTTVPTEKTSLEKTSFVNTETKEIKAKDSPSSKTVSLKNSSGKTITAVNSVKKKSSANLDVQLGKSENQIQKGKPVPRTKSEFSKKPRNNEIQPFKRRDSKPHSTTAIVSTRRPSQAEDKKKPAHGNIAPTGKVSSRTEVKAVLPGRRASQGGTNRVLKEREGKESKTNVGHEVDVVKNVISSSNVASRATQKNKNNKLSHSHIETTSQSNLGTVKPMVTSKQSAAIPEKTVVTPNDSAGQSKEAAVMPKKTAGESQAKEPMIPRNETAIPTKVPAVTPKESKKQEKFKIEPPLSSSTSKNTNLQDKNVNIYTKTSDDGWKLSDLKPDSLGEGSANVVNDEPGKEGKEEDACQENSKTEHSRKRKKASPKLKHSTKSFSALKSNVDLKSNAPPAAKNMNIEEEKNVLKTNSIIKTSSKTISTAPTSDLEKNSKNLKKDNETVSVKTKHVPKRPSSSRIKIQDSKQLSRVTSVNAARKVSEKQIKEKRSMSITERKSMKSKSKITAKVDSSHKPKPVASTTLRNKSTKDSPVSDSTKNVPDVGSSEHETPVGDTSPSASVDKVESDTEVVVQVHVPDAGSPEVQRVGSTSADNCSEKTSKDEGLGKEPGQEKTSKDESINKEPGQEKTSKDEGLNKEPGQKKTSKDEGLNKEPGQEKTSKDEGLNKEPGHEKTSKDESLNKEPGQEKTNKDEGLNKEPGQEKSSKDEGLNKEPGQDKGSKHEGLKEPGQEKTSKGEGLSKEPVQEKTSKDEGLNKEPGQEKSLNDVSGSADKEIGTEKRKKNKNENGTTLDVEGLALLSSNEDDINKFSSRCGENAGDKRLMNIIPRNSLDILKVTKISPKQPSGRSQGSLLHNNSKSHQSFPNKAAPSSPRAPTGPKSQGSRIHRRKSLEGRPVQISNFALSAEGFGLSVKCSPVSSKSNSTMQRLPSKHSSNLEKVDEGSCLETQLPEEHAMETAHALSPQGNSNEKLRHTLSISRAAVTTKTALEKENLENPGNQFEESTSSESATKAAHSLKKTSAVCLNSTSFSDVVQGTQLLNSTKDEPAQNVSRRSSTGSLGSSSSQALKQGGIIPSPPATSKPSLVSPKVSRIKRNASNGSSGRSRASLGSTEMSPTASLEIVKLSSQTSHGWVSSPTSSVKFLPPIDARASKSSNHSDDSQKRRPRTTESAVSRTESIGSRSSTQSKKAAIVEIRRSNSGGLRIDGTSSELVGIKSSHSGNSAKQAVIGF